MTKKFSLFPCALEDVDRIKEKEKWKSELDQIFFERMKNILNESGHWFWAGTNEELVRIRIFYDNVRQELDDLEYLANSLVAIQRKALGYDWPDDAIFDEWKNQIQSVELMEEEEETSQGGLQVEEESTREESSSMGAVNQSVATAECTAIDTVDDEVEEKGLLVTTSPTVREEEKENPQDEENQYLIGGDSSLSQIMSTYSDDEE